MGGKKGTSTITDENKTIHLGLTRALTNVCHAHKLINVAGDIFTLANQDQMPKVEATLAAA